MLSFDEISKFEVGQFFYETYCGASMRFVLISPPVIEEEELRFTGLCVNGEVDFMINRSIHIIAPKFLLI